jgi:Fe-S-cluster containining protein
MTDDKINDICKDCLFWKNWGKKCYVYWDRKKFCTMKVPDSSGNAQFEQAKEMFDINKDLKQNKETKEKKENK